jgi:hypothetical protein
VERGRRDAERAFAAVARVPRARPVNPETKGELSFDVGDRSARTHGLSARRLGRRAVVTVVEIEERQRLHIRAAGA